MQNQVIPFFKNDEVAHLIGLMLQIKANMGVSEKKNTEKYSEVISLGQKR